MHCGCALDPLGMSTAQLYVLGSQRGAQRYLARSASKRCSGCASGDSAADSRRAAPKGEELRGNRA
eukprot:11480211-Alexandrium_andersonii.AAC.1